MFAGFALFQCAGAVDGAPQNPCPTDREAPMDRIQPSSSSEQQFTESELTALIDKMVHKFGPDEQEQLTTGIRQAAEHWRAQDGELAEFENFVARNYLADPRDRTKLVNRFQDNYEQIKGHLHEIDRFLTAPVTLDRGDVLPIDHMFAEYSLRSHLIEEFFKTKIAFAVLLNFKQFPLREKLTLGKKWNRDQWVRARMVDLFAARLPPEIAQQIHSAFVTADSYIDGYNIHMHHLLDGKGQRPFPDGLRLISHWGLRDELKGQYANPDGLPRQRMIQKVMEAIIRQRIPAQVIDNPELDWNVETGEVTPSPKSASAQSQTSDRETSPAYNPEPNTRYEHLLSIFNAERAADPFFPQTSTYMQRKFELIREIPEDDVVSLLKELLSAPIMKEVGALIAKRLGRPLEPFDIWYNGFAPRGSVVESLLDQKTAAKYPSVQSFQSDLPAILRKLGFDRKTADYLASKIVVDPSRGAGHATGADRREDNAHLRTRIADDGMTFKGYNIAIHELGHNVEQVLSLNKIDHYLLSGVPNTAFTEGFAFAFQANDLKLLDFEKRDAHKEHQDALDGIWGTFEISGVALVDIGIWQWMYAHPDADASEVKEAIIKIAVDVWNEYFAPVFGVEDQILLAVYSHIISSGMYIADYAVGEIIKSQMEKHFSQKGLAGEMERMCRLGAITPDAWMHEAVGGPISAQTMLDRASAAVAALSRDAR